MNKTQRILIAIMIGCLSIIVLCICFLGIKANKTYTVNFDTNGGTVITSQQIKNKHTVSKPTNPEKEGYEFKEWVLDEKTFDFTEKVTQNITLKAIWEEKKIEVKKYTIIFNTDGGTDIPNQVINENNTVSKPEDPVKQDYNFIGWFYNEVEFDFNTKITSDLELIAHYEKIDPAKKNYTVNFNSNGGSNVSKQIIEEGKKVTKPKNPTRNGYTFVNWTLNGKEYNFNNVVTKDITLMANWKQNEQPKPVDPTPKPETPKQTFTVTFNTNGGSSINNQKVIEGNKATKPSDPTKTGYTFVGWTLNGNTYNFDNIITSNITLTAHWKQNEQPKPVDPPQPKTYTVKVSNVDQYSPDRILTVYENGVKINVSAIQYNGVTLCSGNNLVVNMYEISGIASVNVILLDGSSVTASVQ